MNLTRLENFRRLAGGGRPDWIPFTLDVGAVPGFTDAVLQRFRHETGAEQPAEFFDYDFRTASLGARFGGADAAALHPHVQPGTTCVFFLHSCGQIEAIIPDIIDVGFHILHPVQPECMSFARVRKQYGHALVLCACLSAQTTLPFGTPDDVRAWVREIKRQCAADQRVILCPSNRIQPETPWANIVAFAEAARSPA